MDVYCKRCGEPWDLDEVRHGMTASEQRRFWDGRGCPSCFGKRPCNKRIDCRECMEWDGAMFECRVRRTKALAQKPFRAEATAVLHGILGDDLDGLAAELEDLEFLAEQEFRE